MAMGWGRPNKFALSPSRSRCLPSSNPRVGKPRYNRLWSERQNTVQQNGPGAHIYLGEAVPPLEWPCFLGGTAWVSFPGRR